MSYIIEKLIEGYGSDIKIRIKDELISSHKFILSHNSKFLEKYLENWNRDKDIIDLSNTIINNVDIVKKILRSWYYEKNIECNIKQVLDYKEYINFLDSESKLEPNEYIEDIITVEKYHKDYYENEYLIADIYEYDGTLPLLKVNEKFTDFGLGCYSVTYSNIPVYLNLLNESDIRDILEKIGFIYPEVQPNKNGFELMINNTKCFFKVSASYSGYYLKFQMKDIKEKIKIFDIVYNSEYDKYINYSNINISEFINKIIDIYYKYCNNNTYEKIISE